MLVCRAFFSLSSVELFYFAVLVQCKQVQCWELKALAQGSSPHVQPEELGGRPHPRAAITGVRTVPPGSGLEENRVSLFEKGWGEALHSAAFCTERLDPQPRALAERLEMPVPKTQLWGLGLCCTHSPARREASIAVHHHACSPGAQTGSPEAPSARTL